MRAGCLAPGGRWRALHTPTGEPPGRPAAGQSADSVGQLEIRGSGHLDEQTTREVLEVVKLATEADGVGPLSEHVMLHLR
jgi:hypothetical protein